MLGTHPFPHPACLSTFDWISSLSHVHEDAEIQSRVDTQAGCVFGCGNGCVLTLLICNWNRYQYKF